MWVLDLELLRDFAASFLAENLFTADPTIFVHEIEPAFDDIETSRILAKNRIRKGFTHVRSMSQSAMGSR